MPLSTYKTVCTKKKLLCPGVWEFAFQKPPGFRFVPGQFVMFLVPGPEDPSDVQVRAYSIASSPAEEELLFVIKLVPGGRASAWFEKAVAPGSAVTMQGPLGAFTVDRKTEKPYLFVATGTGVAPFRSQIRWLLLEEGERRPIHLVFGVPAPADCFWAEEWRELEVAHPQFRAHISFLDGTPDRRGGRGTVQERAGMLLAEGPVSLYLCGSMQAVASLKTACLGAWKVPKIDVHVESFL